MKTTLITTKLLIFLFSCFSASSQTWPSTLLWRISGNGFDKPSYLFGTMHLKDRRLFYFGDSLYRALENSTGFAMEIDPAEMMDSVFSRLSNDNSPLIKEILSEDQYKKSAKKLEKQLGIPAEKITRKKLVDARNSLDYKTNRPDDMKTMVDLYLFDIAKRQGKWVGGIEDVNDQLSMIDELGNNIDVNKYIDDFDDKKRKPYLDKITTLYINQDINQINEMIGPTADRYYDLIRRNIKMARRMDSLGHIRNSFFAVGAAHLCGDSGVISLLRSKGFKVEPVFSSQKIAPEKYTVKESSVVWEKVRGFDSAYTIEMPGKASDLNMLGDELKFKVYADMINNVAYMSCFIFIQDGDSAKVTDRMLTSFSGKGFKKLGEKNIIHLGMPGMEIISLKQEVYYRMQLFTVVNKIYMVMQTAAKREQLYTSEAEHFFESFAANSAVLPKPKNWVDFSDSLRAFSVTIPGKPVVNKAPNNEYENISYSAVDIKRSTYYIIAINETKKGYNITDDSLVFNAKSDYYKEKGFVNTDIRKFEFAGFPAMSFSTSGKSEGEDIVCKLLIVSRGNRSYTVAAVTQKGMEDFPDVTKFFRSFSLLPYKPANWSVNTPENKSFSTWAPSAIQLPQTVDSTAVAVSEYEPEKNKQEEEQPYTAYESSSATTYSISVKPFTKYYWKESDSAFFEDQLSGYYDDTSSYRAKYFKGNFDSLIYKKPVTNGYARGYEILAKNNSKSFYKRIRILRQGDSSYHLFVMAQYSLLYNDNTNRFFDDFRFTKEAQPTKLFTNKVPVILNDVLSNDSATRAESMVALNNAKFKSTELVLLQQAFLKAQESDSTGYYSVPGQIINKMKALDTAANLDFVKNNYSTVAAGSEKRMFMLDLLASEHTSPAVLQIKEALVNHPPVKGTVYSFVYDLKDSLSLAKQLFPEAAILFSDTLLGPGMISVAATLVDSGFIDKTIFTQNSSAVIKTAKWQLAKLKRSADGYISYEDDLVNALTVISDKDAVSLLNALVAVKAINTKQAALLALIKLNKIVPVVETRKVAADRYYRTDFYAALKKMGKQNLFPKEFLSQQKFAEAYMYIYATDEEEAESSDMNFKLLGEKTFVKNGVSSRYYIYKVINSYEDEKYEYPAVCGPFDMNKANPEITGDEYQTKIFYDDSLKGADINSIFNHFIKQLSQE